VIIYKKSVYFLSTAILFFALGFLLKTLISFKDQEKFSYFLNSSADLNERYLNIIKSNNVSTISSYKIEQILGIGITNNLFEDNLKIENGEVQYFCIISESACNSCIQPFLDYISNFAKKTYHVFLVCSENRFESFNQEVVKFYDFVKPNPVLYNKLNKSFLLVSYNSFFDIFVFPDILTSNSTESIDYFFSLSKQQNLRSKYENN